MAMSFGSIFKKKSDNVIEFRGKTVEYEVQKEAGKTTILLGHDKKIKNGWNEPIWLRVLFEHADGHMTISATKADAGSADGKVLYANYPTVLRPEFFPLENDEIQQLVDLVTEKDRAKDTEASE